jgi:hypothetical protein
MPVFTTHLLWLVNSLDISSKLNVFLKIPVKQYEDCYAAIIPHVVADFVLADSANSSITNTWLLSKELVRESVLLGTGYQVCRARTHIGENVMLLLSAVPY